MKLSLDSIGYGGYFTAPGESATLEEAMRRAARFGYDAVCIYAHRPIGFPMDIDCRPPQGTQGSRRATGHRVRGRGLLHKFPGEQHVLLYPQEKEILYVRSAIDLAKDLGMAIVRVLAAFHGYFQNPYANQGYGSPAFESRSGESRATKISSKRGMRCAGGCRKSPSMRRTAASSLALQTHPEITGNNEETLALIDEVGVPSLKVGWICRCSKPSIPISCAKPCSR